MRGDARARNHTGVTVGHEVELRGGDDGTLLVEGAIDATGDEGGTIHVLGDRVALVGATLDASGSEGGGDRARERHAGTLPPRGVRVTAMVRTPLTSTRWRTFFTMPRNEGVLSTVTEVPMPRRPSPLRTRRCLVGRPAVLLT